MRLLSSLLLIQCLFSLCSAAILLPRLPKGGGGGGGGHGSSGGGHASGGGRSGGSSGSGRSSSGTGTGRGGSGDTGHPAVSYGGVTTGGRDSNYFGGGGGRPFTLSGSSLFSGRQMGGGVRADVPGTRAFGSGYPYSVGGTSRTEVAGQPFPFGFWPIYWAGHGHSDEYGANTTVAAQRPGGDQVFVQLTPNLTISAWNTTVINGINETYWMIGDRDSVTTLLGILTDRNTTDVYGCGVQNLTIQSFNSSDPLEPVHFENVIQWYRASSFALAYTGYNNSYALPPLNETADLSWDDSTPLPEALQYSPFLQCINGTISAALPIIDQAPPPLSEGQIAGIVVGSIFAALLCCCCACPCFCALRHNMDDSKKERKKKPTIKNTVVQGKPAYIVTQSPVLRSSPAEYITEKAPSSPSLPPYSLESPGFKSTTSSYTATTSPKPAFMKPGREYSDSSRTLIAESATLYGSERNYFQK